MDGVLRGLFFFSCRWAVASSPPTSAPVADFNKVTGEGLDTRLSLAPIARTQGPRKHDQRQNKNSAMMSSWFQTRASVPRCAAIIPLLAGQTYSASSEGPRPISVTDF